MFTISFLVSPFIQRSAAIVVGGVLPLKTSLVDD